MNPVDKRRVRASFSRSAARYDDRASVQRHVRDRVLSLALAAAPRARRALDVGAGTGALLAALARERPGLATAAIDLAPGMCAVARGAAPRAAIAAADAEALPFRPASFDLVLSTSTFQWLSRLEPAMAEVRRVLAPGGAFCLALFGAQTLVELREAWGAAAGDARRTHRFFTRDEVAAALAATGLEGARLEEELVVERHADARAVLRALREVGAGSAVPGRAGLGGRTATLEAVRRYDLAHGGADGVPATYHVVYAVARR